MDYDEFIESKTQIGGFYGFEPIETPSFLEPFQRHMVEWAIRKGKSALYPKTIYRVVTQ